MILHDTTQLAAYSAKLAQELGYDIQVGYHPYQYLPVIVEMMKELKEFREKVCK